MERSLGVLRRRCSGRERILLDAPELCQIDAPQQSIILAVQLDPLRIVRAGNVNLGRQRRLWHDVGRQAVGVRSLEPGVH